MGPTIPRRPATGPSQTEQPGGRDGGRGTARFPLSSCSWGTMECGPSSPSTSPPFLGDPPSPPPPFNKRIPPLLLLLGGKENKAKKTREARQKKNRRRRRRLPLLQCRACLASSAAAVSRITLTNRNALGRRTWGLFQAPLKLFLAVTRHLLRAVKRP